MTDPGTYIVAHVEEALARDPRVNEQGLHVTIVGDEVVVDGTVSTAERHGAIAAVAAEVAAGFAVRNHAVVADYHEEPDAEVVA